MNVILWYSNNTLQRKHWVLIIKT